MALDTIPKQEGGKLKAVASGTLPSGQPVVVNADGTVSVISGTTVPAGAGSGTYFTSAYLFTKPAAVYDPSSQKVVVVCSPWSSYYATALVGTVSGTSISFGTAVVFYSSNSDYFGICYDPNSQKVVVSWADANQGKGLCAVGTVSGTSISFGSVVEFNGSTGDTSVVYDTNAQKAVVFFRDSSNAQYGKAVVGTVSGTSISFGSKSTFNSDGSYGIDAVFDAGSNKAVGFYYDGANSNYGTAIVGTVSGTSISFGTSVVYLTANPQFFKSTYDPINEKVVGAFQNTGNSNYGTAVVGTVSGTSISFGTSVVFQSNSTSQIGITYDSTNEAVVIGYRNHSNSSYGTAIVGTVSGTSISFGTSFVYNDNGTTVYSNLAYDSNAQRAVAFYSDSASLGRASVLITVGYTSTNLTSENYIGMSGGVVKTLSQSEAIGTESTFETGTVYGSSSGYHVAEKKTLLMFQDQSDSGKIKARLVTTTGTTLSYGSIVELTGQVGYPKSVVYDSVNEKLVVIFRGNTNYSYAVVATISGSSLTFGTPVVFESSVTTQYGIYDSTSGKVVVSYEGSGGGTGYLKVGTVSGTSISFGSATGLSQGLYSSKLAHDPSSNKTVILGYTTANNGKVWLGTVSGTSISVGSAIAFPTTPAGIYGVFYDAPSNKIGFIVQTGGGPGEAYVGTVSGTSISFGSGVQFQSGISQGVSGYDSRVNKFTVACRSISSPYPGLLRIGTISGNTFSFASPVTFNSGETGPHSVCFDSDQGTSIISFMDGGDGDIGKAIGFQASGSYVVTGQVASGGAATVDIVGTVSTNQSGLTAGQQYFVQTDGTLGLTAASPSVLAGTAISATKLVVKT